jgi:hypothetical protein
VVFAVPCVLRVLDGDHGAVGPRHLYVVWWLAALLPALYELVARLDPLGRDPVPAIGAARASRPGHAAPTRAYLALPYVSLLTHIAILHYVYNRPYVGADAAPVLIGLALVLNRYSPNSLIPRSDLLGLRLLLPLAAVLVSTNNPFVFPIGSGYPRLTITPLNLSMAAAFVTYVYCFLLPHAALFLGVGAGIAAVYVLGPSREQVMSAGRSAGQWSAAAAHRLVPRTTAHWGVLGLVASFAFLLLGFWVSLRKRPGELSPQSSESNGSE